MKNVRLLTTSIIIFCLVHLQIVAFNELHAAETTAASSSSGPSAGSMMALASAAGALSSSTGGQNSGGIQASMTGLAVSVVNLSLKNCKGGTMDILAAMTASGVNLVGGMAATANNAEAKSTQIKYSGNSTETKAAIDSQIKSLQDTKDALQTRQKFELGTVTAYLVASGIAIAGKVAVIALERSCKAMAKQAQSVCQKNVALCEQDKQAYMNCTKSSTNPAKCKPLETKYETKCKAFVIGSKTAADAKAKLQSCSAELGTVDAEIAVVDNTLSLDVPSSVQATNAEQELNTMKMSFNQRCGKAPASSAIEAGSTVQASAQDASMSTAAAKTTAEVLTTAKSATGAYQNFMSWIGGFVGVREQAQQAASTSFSMSENTVMANVGSTEPKSQCSQAGTVSCTVFAEQLKRSLAKCSGAVQNAQFMSQEEKYLLAQEAEVKKSGHWERYQEIKNIVWSAFTGDESYLQENILNHQEKIILDYGFGKFAVAIPSGEVKTLNQYLGYHDQWGIMNGQKESISTLTYNDLKIMLNGAQHEVGLLLTVAAKRGIDLLIPSAQAGMWGNIVGAGFNLGGSTGLLNSLTGTQGTFIDKFMVTYGKRAIVFGSSSALLGVAAAATGKSISDIEKDIAKLQKMKSEVDKAASGAGKGASAEDAAGSGGEESAPVAPNEEPENKLADTASVKDIGDASSSDLSYDKISLGNKDIDLAEKTVCITPNCKSLKDEARDAMKNSIIGTGIPAATQSALTNGLKLATEVVDGIQGKNKISASTLGKVDELGKQKGAIQKHVNSLQRQLNDELKALGKAPIDFEGMQNKMMAKLADNTGKAIASGGVDMDALAQALSANRNSAEKDEDFSLSYKDAQEASQSNHFSSLKTSAEDPFKDEEQAVAASNQEEASAGMNQYEDGAIDIVSDTSVPIWKIITTRYVKSGLKRLALKPDDE
ncbi:MAG: hypothetical protein A2202_05560 [Bdellovibrionales bacterium RIFOXYA1_FULL_36_14]|nr:MAG: hypothetical protein A2202_05560 [Bdellovibrionales bacterium RIFOXYA1_FULL_36_14]